MTGSWTRTSCCTPSAAILAAARLAGVATVYSEDLAHSRDYDGVRVVNPFAE